MWPSTTTAASPSPPCTRTRPKPVQATLGHGHSLVPKAASALALITTDLIPNMPIKYVECGWDMTVSTKRTSPLSVFALPNAQGPLFTVIVN